jgi:tetratricopeptide (TPR) repeat protein
MGKRSRKKRATGREVAATKAASAVSLPQKMPSWIGRDWLWGLLLFGAVILVYQPVWYADFIWDDDIHLTQNPCIIGPLGLKEIWTTKAASVCPLVLTVFWVEHAIWGLAPLPYHLVNVLQHGGCAVLLWRVLRSLQIPGAWLGAALWALHPLQVESVAWISEMKNTQSCLFYLLTILFFVKWLKAKESNWNYALTLLFAVLAITSKFSTVVLPIVLALCAWWVEGRWQWRHLLRLMPIVAMSIIASGITLWLGTLEPILAGSPPARSWLERIAVAGDVTWFYVGKLIWPYPLMAIYPRWQIDAQEWFSYLPLLAVLVVSLIFWLKRESWSRPWFFGWAYFLVALSPFLGLIDQSFWRYSFVEDHLQNLAGMGLLALAGTGLVRWSNFAIPGKRWLQCTLGAALLLILGTVSWQRCWAYQSEETLWTDTLAKNLNCWVGYNELGSALEKKGQIDQAMALYQKALILNPRLAEIHYNLGNALAEKGRVSDAIDQYQQALKINPNYIAPHNNLGRVLFLQGRVDEAIDQYRKILELVPESADAHTNLGDALVQNKRMDQAIVEYLKAQKMDPHYAKAWNDLGIAYARQGELDKAMTQFEEAVRLKPDYSAAQNNLVKAKAMMAQRAAQK